MMRIEIARVTDLVVSALWSGAAGRGIFLPDIETSWNFEVMPTGSDILAMQQKDVCTPQISVASSISDREGCGHSSSILYTQEPVTAP